MTDTNKNNFTGKVMYYSNINGQEKKLEKEFSSQDEMNNYIDNNNIIFPSLLQPFQFNGFNSLHSWFDGLFDQKLSRLGLQPIENLGENSSFTELKRKKLELEQEEENKKKEKTFLENRLKERKELKEFFTSKNDTTLVEKAEQGIKECKEKLKTF